MSKMQLIRNQRGAGMYMAMMAAAALGAAGFLMGDIFINAEDVLKQDSRVISYQLLVDTVRKNLYAGNNCTETFGETSATRSSSVLSFVSNGLGGYTSAPLDVVNLTNAIDNETGQVLYNRGVEVKGVPLKIDSDTVVLEPNWKAKTGTSIKSMRLIVDHMTMMPASVGGARTVRYPINPLNPLGGTKNLKAATAYLVIDPDHKGINVWKTKDPSQGIAGAENSKYWIKLFVYMDAATNKIHSCYDPTSEAVFCTETMRGVYVNNPSIPAQKRCRPDVGCFTYKSGVIPASTPCPDSDYTQNAVGSTMKTCSWCPATPYPGISIGGLVTVGVDNAIDFNDSTDSSGVSSKDGEEPEIDCTNPNWYSVFNARKAWDSYKEFQSYNLGFGTPPSNLGDTSGCLAHPPPCYDYPETCANECGGGSTCSCATGAPDDWQTLSILDESFSGSTAPTQCQDECSGNPITTDPNPGTCENECTGDTSACPTCTWIYVETVGSICIDIPPYP